VGNGDGKRRKGLKIGRGKGREGKDVNGLGRMGRESEGWEGRGRVRGREGAEWGYRIEKMEGRHDLNICPEAPSC